MIYFVILIIACMFLCGYQFSYANKLNDVSDAKLVSAGLGNMFLLLSFLTVFLPAAIRYYVGIDYQTYTYNQIPNVLQNNIYGQEIEPLYRAVIKIGYNLTTTGSYQFIFAITAFLICLFVYIYIKQQSYIPLMSLMVFILSTFYNYSLSGMRQSISIAIWLYSLKYLKSNKLIKYLLFVLLAIAFHRSAVLFVLFVFLPKIKINGKITIVLLPLIYSSSFFLRNVIQQLMKNIGLYDNYFNGTYDNGMYSLTQVGFVLFISLISMIARFDTDEENLKYTEIEIKIQYILTLILGLVPVLPTPSRLIYLLLPVCITLVPNTIYFMQSKKIKIIISITVIISFIVYFSYALFVQGLYATLPFRTIFTK